MRTQVLKNVKLVKEGKMKGGKLVYQPIYSSVLDKLNELLGSYHQTHTLNNRQDRNSMSKITTYNITNIELTSIFVTSAFIIEHAFAKH